MRPTRRRSAERGSRWGVERAARRQHGLARGFRLGQPGIFELRCQRTGCGQRFYGRRSDAKFCGPDCRKAAQRRKIPRRCPARAAFHWDCRTQHHDHPQKLCLRPIPTKATRRRMYCNHACQQRAARARTPEEIQDLLHKRQVREKKRRMKQRRQGGRIGRAFTV